MGYKGDLQQIEREETTHYETSDAISTQMFLPFAYLCAHNDRDACCPLLESLSRETVDRHKTTVTSHKFH